MVNSPSSVNVLLTGSGATKTFDSYLLYIPSSRSSPLDSVQVDPEHQAVAKATNQKGQQVDGWDDGEGGRPVSVIAVEEGRGRRRGGGEEVCV